MDRKIKLDLNNKKDYELDKDKISELLIILFDNAIKYTKEKDSITVKTFEENKKLVIQVIDTGIGISDESIDKIFDRFYREDKSRSRETGGNGLGLSIADIIVLLMEALLKHLIINLKVLYLQLKYNCIEIIFIKCYS